VDERPPDGMTVLLPRELTVLFENGVLPQNTQVVVRPIFMWPDGGLAVWIIVNCPN
jgi:hypothetical protein